MKKLIEQYELASKRCKALKELDEKVLTTPMKKDSWSIKEIIGHLYGWDEYNASYMVPRMTQGADLPAFPDHDTLNTEVLNSLEEKSVYEIIDLFLEKRKEMIEGVSNVNEDIRFTIGGKKRAFSPESFLNIFAKHDIHHQKQMDEYLNDKQRGDK